MIKLQDNQFKFCQILTQLKYISDIITKLYNEKLMLRRLVFQNSLSYDAVITKGKNYVAYSFYFLKYLITMNFHFRINY